MKIFAIASCYNSPDFNGYLDIEITKEKDGWYRLPPIESIQTIDGSFQIEAGYAFSGDFTLKIGDDTEISGGTIRTSKKAFFGQGHLSTRESGHLSSETIQHILIKEDTLLSFNYVDVDQLPKFSNMPTHHIQFIPDDQIAFCKRPYGFCNIKFSLS